MTTNEKSEQQALSERIRLRAIRTPFDGISRDEVDRFLIALGHENQKSLSIQIAELRAEMRSTDPIRLLAILATASLFHPEDHDPELTDAQPHLQLHSEIIQALSLMNPLDQYAEVFAVDPSLVQSVMDRIKEVTRTYGLSGLALPTPPTNAQQRSQLTSQAFVRAQTVAVRNLGYADQLKRLSAEVVAPLDVDCKSETGLTLTDLLQFLWNVIALIERRLSEDMLKMAEVWAASSIDEAAHTYYAQYPHLTGEPEAVTALLQGLGASTEQAKFMLLMHREQSYPGYFTLSDEDLASCYPRDVDTAQLRNVVDLWSLNFGDLSGRDAEHFFLDNPIWSQPFIKLDDDTYFCPVPGVLWSFHLRLIEDFVSNRTTLKARYERRRDNFLAIQVEQQFRQAFPSAQIFAGSEWDDPEKGRNGENDLLVILDDVAFVIEDKAGNISDKALRAHPERLSRTLKDLVVKPSEQACNFIDLLQRNPGPHQFAGSRKQVNTVDVSNVRCFVPVSITWESFGAFRLRAPLLVEAGLIPHEHRPTVTMSLADLETVLVTLDSEARRAHYLIRRSELEHDGRIIGDEIDLLGLYLNEGFGVAVLRREDVGQIDLTMQSKHVDQHVLRPKDWPLVDYEGIRLTALWEQLVEDLRQRRPNGWLRATALLLDVPFAVQVKIARRLDQELSRTRKSRSARKIARERRNLNTSGLALELVATRGLGWDELHTSAQATTNLDGPPPVLTICVREEERSKPFLGL